MASPYSYTPRASSTSSRALPSPAWSSSSSSWPSEAGPSSSPPPTSPISYTNQPAYTTIHSPNPYFTYMNTRYDRSIGRERELQRELEMERVSYSGYNNGKGKFVPREPEPRYNLTPPRQSLPSFKELFGDIRLSNTDYSRNISSSSSSSSASSTWSSVSPPAVKASQPYYSLRQTQKSPTIKATTSLPDNVFYSSSEEDDSEDYFRRHPPFRYSQEPSLAEQPLSDEEEGEQGKGGNDSQNTFSFSPERRRSTTFEISSERGLWTNTVSSPPFQHQKRSSEPAFSFPSSLPPHMQDRGSSQPFPTTPRHVSEPAPESDSIHQEHSFMKEKSITPPISSPVQPREFSLPPSSPPMSPILSSSPNPVDKPISSRCCLSNVIPIEVDDCASIIQDDRCSSPPEDMLHSTEDVMFDVQSDRDDSHEKQTDLLEESLIPVDNSEQECCSDNGSSHDIEEEELIAVERAEDIEESGLSARPHGALDDNSITIETAADSIPPSPMSSVGDVPESILAELAHSSPLSSLTSSSRTTPSLDDLVYAMETEAATVLADPIKVPISESSEVTEKEAIVLRPTTSEVVNAPVPAKQENQSSTALCPKPSIPIKETHSTALTSSKAVHTNGGLKRPSQSGSTGPPAKKLRVDPGRPHFDADFFSPSHSHRAPNPQPHTNSSRPAATSPTTSRVVVRVIKRVGVKPDHGKSQQRSQSQVEKHSIPKTRAKVNSAKLKGKSMEDAPARNVTKPSLKRPSRQSSGKISDASKATTLRFTKPTSSGSSSSARSRASRMIVESDSESESDDESEKQVRVAEKTRRLTSPLSSVGSSEAEEEESDDESGDEDDSEEEESEEEEEDDDEVDRKKSRATRKSSKRSTKVPPKPLTPLDPRDGEIIGLLIETMAQSRASSHTVSVLYKTILQTRPGVLARLVEGVQCDDEEEEGRAKSKKAEKERSMRELVRVLELGMERNGMFGRVNSSGRDSSDSSLGAHYFYVPERDEDQERATLIKSIMPRAGKRNETKKYKQYYWKPVEGKRLRWDAVDGI